MPPDRIALVHERFTEVAGSEEVVKALNLEWPHADVHAPVARPSGVPGGMPGVPVTGWLNRFYDALGQRSYAPLLPLMPAAFRTMKIKRYDAVVVSHHAFATQAVFATDAPVVAYVHSPARWAWDPTLRAGEGGGRVGAAILTSLAAVARRCETSAAPKLHAVVANSSAVAERVKQWWGREATVVHPPVDTVNYTPDPSIRREEFFLLAGRLVPYKRPDIAVRAAAAADVPLIVAGDGRAMRVCRQLAGPRTTFLGRLPRDTLVDLHRRARALLMPGVEDFGIVPVESMATGTPVIALGEGGAMDTVVPGSTGMHITPGADDDVVDRFAAAMRAFDVDDYDPGEIRRWATGFSESTFRQRMREVIDAI